MAGRATRSIGAGVGIVIRGMNFDQLLSYEMADISELCSADDAGRESQPGGGRSLVEEGGG